MRHYLDALGWEYETGYLYVARQQRLDELWLTDQMEAAKKGASVPPSLPKLLAEPTEAWCRLEDSARFPRLAVLLDDLAFRIDAFRTEYKLAKRCLELHAGFKERSTDASVEAARKLAARTEKFMVLHTLPEEVKERLSQRVSGLLAKCNAADSRALQDATVELNKATSNAIIAAYVPPGEWAPVPEKLIPSRRTGAQSVILIDNRSGEDLTIEWVDFDGNPSERESKRPGELFFSQTSEGDHFLVSAADGARVGIATADISARLFAVTTKLLEQARRNATPIFDKSH